MRTRLLTSGDGSMKDLRPGPITSGNSISMTLLIPVTRGGSR